jgi:hypothetical protein
MQPIIPPRFLLLWNWFMRSVLDGPSEFVHWRQVSRLRYQTKFKRVKAISDNSSCNLCANRLGSSVRGQGRWRQVVDCGLAVSFGFVFPWPCVTASVMLCLWDVYSQWCFAFEMCTPTVPKYGVYIIFVRAENSWKWSIGGQIIFSFTLFFRKRNRYDIGPVHPAYNPYFSACFFSRNSVFLSQQINQQCFSAGLSAQPNGAIVGNENGNDIPVIRKRNYPIKSTSITIENYENDI